VNSLSQRHSQQNPKDVRHHGRRHGLASFRLREGNLRFSFFEGILHPGLKKPSQSPHCVIIRVTITSV
jgi:hypothetical protein